MKNFNVCSKLYSGDKRLFKRNERRISDLYDYQAWDRDNQSNYQRDQSKDKIYFVLYHKKSSPYMQLT